jgi:CheY-like chemotaxis protein
MFGMVLLAEDDAMIQKILTRMIKRSGYAGEVKIFAEALDALNFVETIDGKLDLAFMDTGLHPSGDAAFYHAFKSIAPNTPVIVSSGYSEDILRGDSHFGGCDIQGVLSKPFGLKDVRNLIESLGLKTPPE